MDESMFVLLVLFAVCLLTAAFFYYRFGPPQYKKEEEEERRKRKAWIFVKNSLNYGVGGVGVRAEQKLSQADLSLPNHALPLNVQLNSLPSVHW